MKTRIVSHNSIICDRTHPLTLIAAIEESAMIVKILTHLGLPTLVNVASSAPILRPFDLRFLPSYLNSQSSDLTSPLR